MLKSPVSRAAVVDEVRRPRAFAARAFAAKAPEIHPTSFWSIFTGSLGIGGEAVSTFQEAQGGKMGRRARGVVEGGCPGPRSSEVLLTET